MATLHDDSAIFTPGHTTQSVRIAPHGGVEPATTWPEAITGEVSWGSRGGALAWNAATSRVMWRRQAGIPCNAETLPFRPVHMAVADGASILWADAAGGLWQWSPGQKVEHVATMPGSGIPRVEGDYVFVAPTVRDRRGRVERRRLGYEWRVDLSTGTCIETAVGSAGQCARLARRGRWTARSHPFADLVRLVRDDGQSLLLACYAPLGVAWAGPSLVITTSDGAVVVFRHLLEELDAIAERVAGTEHRRALAVRPTPPDKDLAHPCSRLS